MGHSTRVHVKPKNHIDLMLALDMVELERGTKTAGFRGYYLKNDGARLSFALWQYALDTLHKKGFSPLIAPSLVRREPFIGTEICRKVRRTSTRPKMVNFSPGLQRLQP